jgi:hypothetical protein
MISGVVHGVIRPPVRATLSTGGGVPAGFQFLIGADGARLQGADGAYLYGRAA